MPVWYPMKFTTPTRNHLFGGTRIKKTLGKQSLPDERIGETWEISDVDGAVSTITNGEFQGKTLRQVTIDHPDEVVGPGWHGPHFPILTKFIDATGMLPVHVHGNDQTAAIRFGELNGKTEAWHILWAAESATFLGGIKAGVSREQFRQAMLAQDYESVMFRKPLATDETVYVPAGTLHSFGPDTLIYEVEQTSDIQQHAMPEMMDGTPIAREQWEKNIDDLMLQLAWGSQIEATAGDITETDAARRRLCCTGPYFTLERVNTHRACDAAFSGAVILTNLGPACAVAGEQVAQAETVLLPAALHKAQLQENADLLLSYLPDSQLTLV